MGERITEMDFNGFIKDFCTQVQKRLGENYLVTVENIRKGREPGDYALCVRNAAGEGKALAYFSVEEAYSDHQRGLSMEPALDKLLEKTRCASRFLKETESGRMGSGWKGIKDCVYPMMIWPERNRELLSMLPHRQFLDLSVGYIIRKTYPGVGTIAIKITKDLQKLLGITEEELYQQALKNLKEDHYQIRNMAEIIRENFTEEEAEKFADDDSLLVLTNEEKWYGAAGVLLEKDFFQRTLGHRSYYVIPSSIHELMFAPADTIWEEEEVNWMLRQVNREQLSEEEWLNDHVYIYNGWTGEIDNMN